MASKSPTVRTTRRRLHALGSGAPRIDVDVDVDALDEHLPSLARLLEERAFAGDDDPQIIRITRDGVTEEGIDVGLRLIHEIDDSVVSALTGFTAPPDWLAIGVSTGGIAYPVDEGRDAPRRRVRLVHLVTRLGTSASVVRLAGEEPLVLVRSAADGTMLGRVDEVCHRALGLPTAPAGNTLEFFAITWLECVLDADALPTTWDALAGFHVAVRVFVEESEPDLVGEASARLVDLGVLLSKILGWSVLRSDCGAGRWTVDDVPPAVARWLDDGAFSRWVRGSNPPLEQLTTAVCELLAPALARRLRAVLTEWGLDPPIQRTGV